MTELPRLHVVTDDSTLARPGFVDQATAILSPGAAIALHLRGHATATRVLFALAEQLVASSNAATSIVLVNDRVDVALATGAHGVQLGARSIPLMEARTLLGARLIGYSAHDTVEARRAESDGTDFVVLGTIYRSASHPDAPPGGPARIREAVARVRRPVIAIGGVTPERVGEALHAGAYGVAVIQGVWAAADPVASARAYFDAIAAALHITE